MLSHLDPPTHKRRLMQDCVVKGHTGSVGRARGTSSHRQQAHKAEGAELPEAALDAAGSATRASRSTDIPSLGSKPLGFLHQQGQDTGTLHQKTPVYCLLFSMLIFLLLLSSSAPRSPAFSWSVFVFYSGLPVRSESTDLEKPVWDQILTCALPGRWLSPLFCLIFLILESGNN